jgi:hypothetical protein
MAQTCRYLARNWHAFVLDIELCDWEFPRLREETGINLNELALYIDYDDMPPVTLAGIAAFRNLRSLRIKYWTSETWTAFHHQLEMMNHGISWPSVQYFRMEKRYVFWPELLRLMPNLTELHGIPLREEGRVGVNVGWITDALPSLKRLTIDGMNDDDVDRFEELRTITHLTLVFKEKNFRNTYRHFRYLQEDIEHRLRKPHHFSHIPNVQIKIVHTVMVQRTVETTVLDKKEI